MSIAISDLGFFFETHEIAHVVIVVGLSEVGTEIEPVFVDELDAQVLEPEGPAGGTNVAIDPFANGIGERRGGELPGPFAFHAAGTLATETGPWTFLFHLRCNR